MSGYRRTEEENQELVKKLREIMSELFDYNLVSRELVRKKCSTGKNQDAINN